MRSDKLIDRLIDRVVELRSPILVGLDPQLKLLPREIVEAQTARHGENIRAHAAAFLEFNMAVIDAVDGIAACVKPQIAFYEELGAPGIEAYIETCAYAHRKGLVVVADAKRGDIGSTSSAYARAFLSVSEPSSRFYSDFLTVNPYLGDDCLNEFLREADSNDKGIFVLVKTSNPSSAQIQDLRLEGSGRTVYQTVADMVERHSGTRIGRYGLSAVGAVVGATYPEQLRELRLRMPTSLFLVPGYGAQGGRAEDVVHALREDGSGALINSSRGIIYAPQQPGEHFSEAIRRAAAAMRDDIRAALDGRSRREAR